MSPPPVTPAQLLAARTVVCDLAFAVLCPVSVRQTAWATLKLERKWRLEDKVPEGSPHHAPTPGDAA